MKNIVVIAPHPDDETLGCGGTLLRHKSDGHSISCINITNVKVEYGWSSSFVQNRKNEIDKVVKKYNFDTFFDFDLKPSNLGEINFGELVSKISKVFLNIKPQIIYFPYLHDVHSDHQIVSKSVNSNLKWFRQPSIEKALMYETISETNFNFLQGNFSPNYFVNISKHMKDKLEIMKIYKSEFKKHPFPRSNDSIKALAILRGSQSGYKFAEAFKMVYKRY